MALAVIRYTYQGITYRAEFNDVSKDVFATPDSSSPSPGQLVITGEPTIGQYIYSNCEETTLDRVRFDGADQVAYDPEADSASCQSGNNPPNGTFIRNDCYGVDRYQVVADGNGGERQGALVEANSTECGYVAPEEPEGPPAAGIFYPVGGILPNPIEFTITADPLLEGEPKRNHFVKATIYRHSDDSPIGTMQARVYNGQAVLDVAAYLRPLVKTSMDAPADIVTVQEGAVVRFYIGHKEAYNGTETEEILINEPPRYAVEAATDGISDGLVPYVLAPPIL